MPRPSSRWITSPWVTWPLLVAMVGVIGVLAFLGSRLTSAEDNDIASFLPGDAESTKVIERVSAFSDPDQLPAIVVLTRDGGLTRADAARAAAVKQAIAEQPDSDGTVVGPIPSRDGEALQLITLLKVDSAGFEDLPDIVDGVRDAATDNAGDLDVHVAGPAALGADQAQAFAGIDGILLLAAIGVVIVMLLLTYRSPILWIIPLICGVASVGMAQGIVYLLAEHAGLTVNAQSAGILSVLVLGAGIDYALLLVARYREELRRTERPREAMATALRRAAPAILASGTTVVIGLLCLVLAQLNSTSGLGPVAAVGIVVSLLIMLVLLPILLVTLGRWVFWPFIPRLGDTRTSESGLWGRVGSAIAKAPRVVWVVTTVVLLGLSVGIVQLDADGLTNEQSFTTTQPSIIAEKVLAEHFPGGAGDPVQVLARADAAPEVSSALGRTRGIASGSVTEPVVRGGTAYLEATLSDPADSTEAFATIDRVRERLHSLEMAEALVGGNTAVNHDVQEAAAADNTLIIPIVLGVVLLVLIVVLRSLLAPLILLATVVVSFGAALGISALVFRHVLGFEGADSSFPLFVFVFLVALGIDYNIFLMTRVREESLQLGTRRGALVGLAATGGVITSAGLVLAGTFAALGSLPIVFLAEIGFAVALGVLLDTIVVRSVLVTALTLDIGRWMWWPSLLWRTDGRRPMHAPPTHAPPSHRA